MGIQAAPADFALSRDGDIWVATHIDSGVAGQGSTPTEAVAMAEEAAELSRQEHQPGDDEFQQQMLHELGIEPSVVEEEIDTPDGMP